MFLSKRSVPQSRLFWMGVIAILLGSLALRFWGLGRFNMFVFDEVYYVKFAAKYLTWTPFFDGHPPFSKYLLALGIWLGEHVFFINPDLPRNSLAGLPLSPLSYRWLNALTGSLIPLVVMGIAFQISHRRSYTLIAGFLIALDGLFLVESRYALNNVYLVILGLLGQWLFLLALAGQPQGQRRWPPRRSVYLLLSGVLFGACAAIKWNGLWFLLGVYFLWGSATIGRFLQAQSSRKLAEVGPPAGKERPLARATPALRNLTTLQWPMLLLYLGVVPALVYSLLWIPHLKLDPTYGFWEIQWQILSYHQRVGGNDPSVHPYCSPWSTWPWMIRPVLYVYETARDLLETVPVKPPVPAGEVRVIYDVHAMGNPMLWWFSTLSVLGLGWALLLQLLSKLRLTTYLGGRAIFFTGIDLGIVSFLVLNYLANLIPWMGVTRCTFVYHYMGSLVYAVLGIAWIVDRGLQSDRQWPRLLGITVLSLSVLALCFWLPIYLGLPLSPAGLQARRWLPTW